MITQVRTASYPRPFLKWAGGKHQLIPQYQPYFPPRYRNYYEPFVGGGAVFFHLQPQSAHLIDINAELVNVYRCVRDRVSDLIALLEDHRQAHSPEHYYAIRSLGTGPAQSPGHPEDEVSSHHLERAARLIYLNKTCFNGLYRENAKGHFNVPIGSYKKPPICDPDLLQAASAALATAQIEQGSFAQVLNYAKTPDDFVYFDPPYYPISTTSNFTAYHRYTFAETEQIHLRETFAQLHDRGVKVMLSNSDCDFVRDLYRDYHVHTIYANRNINCNPEKRGKITEVLVTSY
jgi:DNA adenine methylase